MPAGSLASRRVALRAVRPSDTEWLYELLVVRAGARTRYRGRTPSPGDFHAELWRGVHAQFVVESRDGVRCGLVGLYNTNLVAAHSHVFATSEPAFGHLTSEATGLLLDWAFREFELSKVWIEATTFNLAQYPSILELATTEGTLTNHEYWRGRFWDLLVLSVTAEQWRRRFGEVVELSRSGTATAPLDARGELEQLVAELWPLDSLGAAEVLCTAEETLGVVLPDGALAGLPLDGGPATFVDELLGRAEFVRSTRPA